MFSKQKKWQCCHFIYLIDYHSFSYIKTRDKMYTNERQEILLVLQLSLVFSFVGIQKLDL